MEFHKKLQELRKQKEITQEELAQYLYVSRTAVSKWESGRGYPNIDSLKAIAAFFNLSIDELLSSNQLLTIAEEDTKQKEMHYQDLVFGLLDLSVAILLFLPFFGQKINGIIQEVSLLSLTEISKWLHVTYLVITICITVWGIATLTLQNLDLRHWIQYKQKISLFLNTAALLLFVLSLQPYAASMLLIF